MYVCVCMGVCDGEIESAIEAGASSVEAVMIATRAGTRCGSCRPEIAQMLRTGGEDRPSCISACDGRRHLEIARTEPVRGPHSEASNAA